MIAHLCGFFKSYSGERAWKAICNRLWKPYYLSRVDHVRKIKDRKQRTYIGKYSFVNRTIKNWNQLLVEALETFPCKPKIFRKRVTKTIINGVKWNEQKCGKNHLKMQWSEVKWSEVRWSTGLSKKMDGIWNRYNLKSTGRIYTFGVLKCSEKFKVLDLP